MMDRQRISYSRMISEFMDASHISCKEKQATQKMLNTLKQANHFDEWMTGFKDIIPAFPNLRQFYLPCFDEQQNPYYYYFICVLDEPGHILILDWFMHRPDYAHQNEVPPCASSLPEFARTRVLLDGLNRDNHVIRIPSHKNFPPTQAANGRFRILLAEDNPGDQRLFEFAIENVQSKIQQICGKDVCLKIVSDAVEALVFCTDPYRVWPDQDRASLPDMIITDYQMPNQYGMTGSDLVWRLKAMEETRRIPTFIFSSLISEANHTQRFSKADHCFAKPSDLIELEEVIIKMIEFSVRKQHAQSKGA